MKALERLRARVESADPGVGVVTIDIADARWLLAHVDLLEAAARETRPPRAGDGSPLRLVDNPDGAA